MIDKKFNCDDLKKDKIIGFHATSRYKDIKKQGYIGKDQDLYFSLSPTLAEGYDIVNKENFKDKDTKLLQIEPNVKDVNINYECPLVANIALNLNNFKQRVCGKEETHEICTLLTEEFYEQGNNFPLSETYPICKVIGSEEYAEMVYAIIPKEKGKVLFKLKDD